MTPRADGGRGGEPHAADGRPGAMRRILIAAGALGGGTAVAFLLAGIAFLAAPDGRIIPVQGNGAIVRGGPDVFIDPEPGLEGWERVPPGVAEPPVEAVPIPMPAVDLPATLPES